LGFYRTLFPRTYAQAVREYEQRRQDELDAKNLKWVLGPDPFTQLPRELRRDFDLDVLLGGDEVKAAYEQEMSVEAQIDESREKMATAMRVPSHQLGPSSQEIMESVERGPGCHYCNGAGLISDMWSGARTCDYCTTGVAERIHQERQPKQLEGAKLIAVNMALNDMPYDETEIALT
jgi:hypothetical protein